MFTLVRENDSFDDRSDVEKCYSSFDPGPCKTNFTKWYFSKSKQSCQQFIYGGCNGNENRFDTEEECQRKCMIGFLDFNKTMFQQVSINQQANPIRSFCYVFCQHGVSQTSLSIISVTVMYVEMGTEPELVMVLIDIVTPLKCPKGREVS